MSPRLRMAKTYDILSPQIRGRDGLLLVYCKTNKDIHGAARRWRALSATQSYTSPNQSKASRSENCTTRDFNRPDQTEAFLFS